MQIQIKVEALPGTASRVVDAYDGDARVGGVLFHELPRASLNPTMFFVYDVDETHRRRGVATAMLRRVEEIALERGIGETSSGPSPTTTPRTRSTRRSAASVRTW